MEIHNPDPMEELVEVYEEVKEVENNFGRSIEIAIFIIEKNKELLAAHRELNE